MSSAATRSRCASWTWACLLYTSLANVLLQSGNDVAVIEENLQTADHLSIVLEGRYLVIHGDGCDSKYQELSLIHI